MIRRDAVFRPVRRAEPGDGTERVNESCWSESRVFRCREFEQSIRAIASEQRVDVEVVAWSCAIPQSKHLVCGEIIRVQHGADVEGDEATESAAVGEDFDGALGSCIGIYGHEAMLQRGPFGVMCGELLVFQRAAQCDDYTDRFLVIYLSEQVDVLGRAIDEPVSDHGSATGESKRACFGEPQRCACDLFLQRIERHAPRLPPDRSQ